MCWGMLGGIRVHQGVLEGVGGYGSVLEGVGSALGRSWMLECI